MWHLNPNAATHFTIVNPYWKPIFVIFMCRSISVQSIKKANGSLMYNQSRSFSSDGSVAAIRCRTVGGRRTLYVPTKKIIDAANNALKHSGK